MASKSKQETLLEFPCDFPIKVMGRACGDFEATIIGIVRRYVPDLGEGAVKTRDSRGGNYVSVTVMIHATGKEQLDNIYRDLTACEQVLMAL